ncbi:MAG: hypothetical protein DRH12_02455 [Deltaproteobacteria bacterium]|nr:MAG: hypothetical protein DRH12_02455 [Deltaproteobacteria bacterium]
MKDINEDRIRQLVLETLRQMGIKPGNKRHKGVSNPNGPRALIVFNSGLSRMEDALEQVRLIESLCSKAAFFTMGSARGFLCKNDIKEKAGGRCVLDTVSEKGVERVLKGSDVLVLPTFCFTVAAKLASLVVNDFESQLVFMALIQGKKILATRDSFSFLELMQNERMERHVEAVLKKLEEMGMRFCITESLKDTFFSLISEDRKEAQRPESGDTNKGVKLVTGRVITEAFEKGIRRIRLASGGKVTPLAKDLAKEYSIEIVEG